MAQDWFGELEIPVAQGIPPQVIDDTTRLVKTKLSYRVIEVGAGLRYFDRDPTIERVRERRRIEIRRPRAAIEQSVTSRVPEFGHEVAVALNPFLSQFEVSPRRREEARVKRTESQPYFSIKSIGSIIFPFDLDIFCPFSSRTKA